jgi:hypothetical protein
MVLKQKFSSEEEIIACDSVSAGSRGRDEVGAAHLSQARLAGGAGDALGVANDVEVCVDECAKFANKFAFTVPPLEREKKLL